MNVLRKSVPAPVFLAYYGFFVIRARAALFSEAPLRRADRSTRRASLR